MSGHAGQARARRHAVDEDATNAYQSLSETTRHDDPRWAFGFGIEDVEAEVTAPVPDGADAADLAIYCQMLGDDALVYSHRLSEWVSNAPELEEEVALANIALDLLGQGRVLLARAGHLEGLVRGRGGDEDTLAFFRDQAEFRNVALAEQSDELDFARCIARLLVFSTWRLALLHRLRGSTDPVIAAVADRGTKELTYHRDYAARWTLRLGDGTAKSRRRMQAALDWIWPYVEELFGTSAEERRLTAAGAATDPTQTRDEVDDVLTRVLGQATLSRPERPPMGLIGGRGGRQGIHTEQLGRMLAEMQSLARQHPGARW